MEQKACKVVLIGEGGVGKSVWLNRCVSGKFNKAYVPTMGVEVHPLIFNTNRGTMTVKVWDCAGQEKHLGLDEGYYVGAKAAIVMFDVTSKLSFRNVKTWIKKLQKINPDIHIVLCGNKVDCNLVEVNDRMITEKYPMFQYYCTSAKPNSNFEKPFLSILSEMKGEEIRLL